MAASGGCGWSSYSGQETERLVGVDLLQEVRLAVEGKELEGIAEKSSLLCSCFCVLESAIVYVSRHSDQDDSQTSKNIRP